MTRPWRLLYVASHPVQYIAPLFRQLAARADITLEVAYCSLQGAQVGFDPGFGVPVAWDVPLLDGYTWTEPRNISRHPRTDSFFGLVNPELWTRIRKGQYDAVFVAGYSCASYAIAMMAARMSRTALLLATDGTTTEPRGGGRLRRFAKPRVVPPILRIADIVCVPGTAASRHVQAWGVPVDRVALTHYVVDNDTFASRAAGTDPAATRRELGIPVDATVLLFCAKLQPWKRPMDALQAFAQANVPNSYLLYAGDGPLRAELELEALRLGVASRVRFLGFVNQSRLPSLYASMDALLLPSAYEPWGMSVNEAMACGKPAIVSDQVGSHLDLVEPGRTGFVFPAGDVPALSQMLAKLLADPASLRAMGETARDRIATWSYREHADALVKAVSRAVARKRGTP